MHTQAMIHDRKIINVTGKRQITIPIKFYEALELSTEVECILEEDSLVIRPLKRENNEFSVEILKDLVGQGYEGDELIKQFELQSKRVKRAVRNLLEEADNIASGKKPAAGFKDIFGKED